MAIFVVVVVAGEHLLVAGGLDSSQRVRSDVEFLALFPKAKGKCPGRLRDLPTPTMYGMLDVQGTIRSIDPQHSLDLTELLYINVDIEAGGISLFCGGHFNSQQVTTATCYRLDGFVEDAKWSAVGELPKG